MAGTGDDSSTDAWADFRLLREAHAHFLELTGLERLAAKLVVNFLRGGEFDFEGRRRYRLYEIDAFPGGTAPSPYDGEFWCSYPERGIHCDIDHKHSSAHWTGPVTAEWQAFDGRQQAEYNITLIWVCWGAVLDFLQGVGFLSERSQSDSTRAEQSSSEQSQPDSMGAEQSSPPEQPASREEPQAEETSQESSSEKEEVAATSRPVGNVGGQLSRLQEMRRAGMLKGVRQNMAASWAPAEYPPDGDIPDELTNSEMVEAIQQWRKGKGLPRLADEALRRFCARFLKAYRKKPSP